jgi:hypothetical protein
MQRGGIMPDVPFEWSTMPEDPGTGGDTQAGGGGDDPKGPGVEAVGPKGYIHGWIYVGPPGVGGHVFHPHHGHGTITRSGGGKVSVRFHGSDEVKTFEHKPGKGGADFQQRPKITDIPPRAAYKSVKERWAKDTLAPVAKDAAAAIYGTNVSRWNGDLDIQKQDDWWGVMAWDGWMGLAPARFDSMMDTLNPDDSKRIESLDGIKTFLHELNHATGSGEHYSIQEEVRDYQTLEGKSQEEGFTELGAWLQMPEFLRELGISDKPTAYTKMLDNGEVRPETLAEWYERHNDPVTFTGHTPWVNRPVDGGPAYPHDVKRAYDFLDSIAVMEDKANGVTRYPYEKERMARITELSKEVNAVAGPTKRDVMARQYMRAAGLSHRRVQEKLTQDLVSYWFATDPVRSLGQTVQNLRDQGILGT